MREVVQNLYASAATWMVRWRGAYPSFQKNLSGKVIQTDIKYMHTFVHSGQRKLPFRVDGIIPWVLLRVASFGSSIF